MLRAWPYGLPCNPQATARRCSLPARSEGARAPATQTKRARLPAFSTEQPECCRLADWRLSKVSLASGRAGQLVLPPSLLSLPVQKPEQRGPRDPIRPPPDCEPSAQPGLTRAGPARRVPLRLADWRLTGSARLLQSQQAGARPRVPGSEANKPRAPDRFRFVRGWHEGCKPGRCTTGRYIQCSTNAPAPADAGPPVAAALYITPVVPLALSGLSR